MTTKPTAAAAAAEPKKTTTTAEPETAAKGAPPLVGTMLAVGVKPETVTLSHYLRVEGVDYQPGDSIRVSPDFAQRLRTQGYVART
ncbi:hypothetical protein [Streptomyces sp. NPDC000880]